MQRVTAIIDGQSAESRSAQWFEDVDPSSGEVIAEVARCDERDVEEAVRSGRSALPDWSDTPVAERSRVLRRLGQLIVDEVEPLSALESRDTGKPLRQARTDAEVAARYFEYYAGVAEAIHGDSIPLGPDILALTLHEPLGVTAHITAWNYPMQIACRSIAPALAAGNTCILKPAEEAPLTSVRVGELAVQAGLPPGVLNVVPGFGDEAGAALAASEGIDHLSFTGSLDVARLVAAAAARNVVPVSLELGGKSPNIVFADADLGAAVPTIVNAVIQNAGQTCSAGSRLLVQQEVHEEVVRRVAERFGQLTVGAGLEDPDMGPLISEAQHRRALTLIEDGRAAAKLVTGGGVPKRKGWFIEPTLFDDVPVDARIAQEEVFAPVLATLAFSDVDEAVALAEATEYGLLAGVWSRDIHTAMRVGRRLRAGQVYVNAYGVGGGVELPFGGFKRSGYGRQKGVDGYLEMTQTKTLTVRT